jgi:hypothetical protein
MLHGLFARTRRARKATQNAIETRSKSRHKIDATAPQNPLCSTSPRSGILKKFRPKAARPCNPARQRQGPGDRARLGRTSTRPRGLIRKIVRDSAAIQGEWASRPHRSNPVGGTPTLLETLAPRRDSAAKPENPSRRHAVSQTTSPQTLNSNHTTLLPRSRQKTCRVWKLKTTTHLPAD